nr:hypothetical protein [Tanacetum cinerariifolium]
MIFRKRNLRILTGNYPWKKSVIRKSDVVVVPDSEDTLMHAEESRSKLIEKQNDPQMIEKKVITKPIDYAILNQLSIDFNTRFMPQTESSAEQAFWSEPLPQLLQRARGEKLRSLNGDVMERKVTREVEEIESLNLELDHKVDVAPLVPKLRKNRTAHTDYIRHTQEEAATLREIVESERLLSPLNTSLAYACKYTRQIQELLMILQQTCPSITDLGTQLVAVTPKNKTKQIRRTAHITKLERITVATSPSANIDSNTPVLSSTGVTLVSRANGSKSQDNTKKNRIRRTQKKAKKIELEDHLRIVKSSLNKASVVDSKATSSVIKIATATIVPPREPIPIVNSTDKPVVTLEKDTVILKVKERIKSFSGDDKERRVEKEIEEIETLNLELDHKVTTLTAENNHLKQTYKQLFDSIKSSRVQSKEQCDDLINKVNLKSVEVADLNASLQEKVLVITALKEQLKGKAVLTKAVSLNPIDPALLQVDVVPLVPKLRKNRTAHIDYIKHTLEEAATLRELVESERLLSPLNTPLAYACKYTRRIQELLMILQQTCPRLTDLGTNLVAVTPKNQTKQ